MNLSLMVNIFVQLMLLAIIATFFVIKRRAGRSLIKIYNYKFSIFCSLGIVFFVISTYSMFLKINKDSIFIAITMLLLDIYFIGCSIIIRNSVCEKGIIVLENFPIFIKWNDVQRFGVNGKIIYVEKKKGYASMDVSSENIKDLEEILSEKIKKEIS